MQKFTLSILALFLLLLTSCSPNSDEPTIEPNSDEPTIEPIEDVEVNETGLLPFAYPETSTDSKNGEYVLAPSKTRIDGMSTSSYLAAIFYNQTMLTAGETSSTLSSLSGEYSVPNSLIIPIPAGETAEPGDIVLTWWQSGSGMVRAYVVEGGTDSEPMVHYMDVDFTNPVTESQPEQLMPNSFVNITNANDFTPGTAVAVMNEYGTYNSFIVINEANGKLLLSGHAGNISSADKKDAIALPVTINLSAGDIVYASVISLMKEVEVVAVYPEIARVLVKYQSGSSEKEVYLPFGDFITDL